MGAQITRRRLLAGVLGLGAAGVCGAPVLARGVDAEAEIRGLAEARLWPWEGGSRAELAAAHAMNPEYDLMSRAFLALALGDLATAAPEIWRDRAVAALDAMIGDTEERVARRGHGWFLLPYAGARPFVRQGSGGGRSLFVDGELLLMMAIRRLLAEDERLAAASRGLLAEVREAMAAGPIGCAESYPDECWLFCNTVALAAGRLMEALDGAGAAGAAERRRWAASARARLIDPESGLLVSSFTLDGSRIDGPEGSTIWLAIHMLRLIDPALAREQYDLARAALGRSVLGLGYAREWPPGATGAAAGRQDVDSGEIVPLLEASPSSSGLALLAARSMGDAGWHRDLRTSLQVAAFPAEEGGRRRFRASNAVGDAVILAGLVAGPLWARIGAAG